MSGYPVLLHTAIDAQGPGQTHGHGAMLGTRTDPKEVSAPRSGLTRHESRP